MKDLKEHIDDVQRKCSYYFKNTDLLLQAFTRKSYSAEFGGENNEVLQFLGDRVLDFYVTKVIAERYGFSNFKRIIIIRKKIMMSTASKLIETSKTLLS